jgi:hypothetical protein
MRPDSLWLLVASLDGQLTELGLPSRFLIYRPRSFSVRVARLYLITF